MKENCLKVISIEGIDGTGKTGVLDGLKNTLGTEETCFVSFPTKWFYGKYEELKEEYREYGGDLLAFERKINQLQSEDKLRVYEQLLAEGKKVLYCDRFDVSQKVYNGSVLGEEMTDVVVNSDYVIHLDVDVETVLKRISSRGEEDYMGYEQESTLRQLRERYLTVLKTEYAGKYRVVSIKPEETPEEVLQRVLDIIREEWT